MNFGRSWNFDPLQQDEAIISSSLMDSLSISAGDLIHVSVNLSRYLVPLLNELNLTDVNRTDLFSFRPCWTLVIAIC